MVHIAFYDIFVPGIVHAVGCWRRASGELCRQGICKLRHPWVTQCWHCGLHLLPVRPQREEHNEWTLRGLGWAGVPLPGNLACSRFCVDGCSCVWSICVCPVQMQYLQNGRIRTALEKQLFPACRSQIAAAGIFKLRGRL